eukprot:scaffold3980_cov168-Amphora_coffeaeformis.AAC.2
MSVMSHNSLTSHTLSDDGFPPHRGSLTSKLAITQRISSTQISITKKQSGSVIIIMPCFLWSIRRCLLLLVCLASFLGFDQAFVVSAWKLPFRRGSRQQQQQGTTRTAEAIAMGATAANSHVPGGPMKDPPVGLAAETQELLRDIEEAIDLATKSSKHWIRQIPIPPVIKTLYEQLVAIVLYKPPVGIVALFVTTRLVTSGRLFRLYAQSKDPKSSVEDALAKQYGRESEEGRRALLLDPDDIAYQTYGGVDRVRQQVCAAALQCSTPAPSAWAFELQKVLKQAIQLESRSSRLSFLQDASPVVSRLETLMGDWSPKKQAPDEEQVWLVAAHATQVRVTDALLRVTRDRLLKTTHRLGRTVSYWNKRVQQSQRSWIQQYLPWQRTRQLEQDRLRLAYATAAYQHERTQLGKVVQLLLDRPADLPSDQLLQAYKESKQVLANEKAKANENSENDEKNEAVLPAPVEPFSINNRRNIFGPRGGADEKGFRLSFPSFSKYHLRFRRDGKGLLALYEAETVEELHPEVATRVLLSHEKAQDEPFPSQARAWTNSARNTICSVVQESLKGSPSKPKYDMSIEDFETTSETWCQGNPTTEDNWKRLLVYVNNLARWRRTGEGQTVSLRDAALISWTRRLDVCGIPSTLLTIYAAYWIHHAVIPHWPEFRAKSSKAILKVFEILQQRVWVPVKGIYDEIMNKGKGMMSGFGLPMEEQTLDHLLRDMGFGDGTVATRSQALQKAAEQYEHDLNSGVFVNFARGRLVRLLLIQVQQLKVGLLSALDTIDVLMKGNQIHFQFLAAIPAVLIAGFGTRFFLRFLYSIRSKDLRPVTVAHAKMASYLSQMERLILLDEPVTANADGGVETSTESSQSSTRGLSPATLGEISLYMYNYLTLLDFSSTLFPSTVTEQIHVSLQGLLGTTIRKDGSTDLTLRWLDRIQNQHRDLLKHKH